jgi:hypothetical protein
MRRTDLCEREELERMLNMLVHVKECIRSFEEGELSLRDAVAAISAGLATPLSGKVDD